MQRTGCHCGLRHTRHFVRQASIKTISYALCASVPALARAAQTPNSSLLPFDANSLAALKKAHAGKPFVLAFWSVYCERCRDEMLEWNAVKRAHTALPIALVSTDTPADRALIDAFLLKYPPGPVQRHVFTDAMSERVRYAVDKSWRGELPKTYFFDTAHRVEVKSGRVDRAWISAWYKRSTQ